MTIVILVTIFTGGIYNPPGGVFHRYGGDGGGGRHRGEGAYLSGGQGLSPGGVTLSGNIVLVQAMVRALV